MYIRGALGCILVCEHQNMSSIENLRTWKKLVEENWGSGSSADALTIPVYLLENKIDKKGPNYKNDTNRALEAKVKELRFDNYFETSAQDDYNLKEAFMSLTDDILRKGLLNSSYNYENYKMKHLSLSNEEEQKKSKFQCNC